MSDYENSPLLRETNAQLSPNKCPEFVEAPTTSPILADAPNNPPLIHKPFCIARRCDLARSWLDRAMAQAVVQDLRTAAGVGFVVGRFRTKDTQMTALQRTLNTASGISVNLASGPASLLDLLASRWDLSANP